MNQVLIDSYWFNAFLYPLLSNKKGMHIPAQSEHSFWFNLNTYSGLT